jgi:hypothetical protein
MPIQVICPGCHTQFTVGDQHAGKTGACPKCKAPITIPKKEDEVVIHAPELEAGAKDAKGRSVLKPIRRKEAKFKLTTLAIVAGLALLTVAVAWLVGRNEMSEVKRFIALAIGSVLLGPPLAYAGYTFLRDDELGYYRGKDVLLRSLACGLVYALLWGVYVFVGQQVFGDDQYAKGLEMVPLACLAVPTMVLGAGTAFVCFDLEMLSGFFHYALYFVVCIGLRFVMDLPLLPGMGH